MSRATLQIGLEGKRGQTFGKCLLLDEIYRYVEYQQKTTLKNVLLLFIENYPVFSAI